MDRTTIDRLGGATFGMTLTEAHDKGVCIMCKKQVWVGDVSTPNPAMFSDENSKHEYVLSGICGICWDEMFKEIGK